MLDDLRAALTASNWPLSLELALVAWRETRAPALADIVEAVAPKGLRVDTPPVDKQLHAWWIGHARDPHPAMIGALLATLRERWGFLDTPRDDVKARWRRSKNPLVVHLTGSQWCTNAHERIAAMLEWPDDPRVSATLLQFVIEPMSSYPMGDLFDSALVERLGRLADVRARPILEKTRDEPRGGNQPTRDRQVKLAHEALAALRSAAPRDPGPLLAACVALALPPRPPPAPSREQIDALWSEVAANPDDVGTRSVLGDALVEAGDLRGDLIMLQCNARVPNRPLRGSNRKDYDGRVKTLLRKQWHEWLGDLDLIIVRRGSQFHCGMLEVARIGQHSTPPWAWRKVRGHRELHTVHTVTPGWITAEDFADFVNQLPREPRMIAIDQPEALAALARLRPHMATNTLELRDNAWTTVAPPVTGWRKHDHTLRDTLDVATKLFPRLGQLTITTQLVANELVRECADAKQRFPELRRIVLAVASLGIVPQGIVNELRANPLVEFVQSS